MCVCGSQQEVRLLGRSEWLLFMHDLQWLSHTRVKIVWQPPYDYRENGQLSDDCIEFFLFFSSFSGQMQEVAVTNWNTQKQRQLHRSPGGFSKDFAQAVQ